MFMVCISFMDQSIDICCSILFYQTIALSACVYVGRTSRPETNDSVVPPSPLQVFLFSFEDLMGSAAGLLLATIFQTKAELKKVKCGS
jgi:hypothetical protein